jgi:hypothetical protein
LIACLIAQTLLILLYFLQARAGIGLHVFLCALESRTAAVARKELQRCDCAIA